MSYDDPSRPRIPAGDSTFAEPLTHAGLQHRQREIHDRHRRAVGKVGELLETQKRVGAELGQGLTVLSRQRTELEGIERRETDPGVLATLVRPFVGRRNALARRSIAEGLIDKYEQVSVRLREATAFSDELQLCSLELQAEVDQLHRDLSAALERQRESARRVLELETTLADDLVDATMSPEWRDQLRDRNTFDLRRESVSLSLYGAATELCRQHLEPARALRDTVLRLHEEMATYVISATHTVNAAGRRIGALGMLADAPIVVAELHESLEALGVAIEATTQWIDRSQRFIVQVLPELSARVRAEGEANAAALAIELEAHDRERSRREAERALRHAAEAEVARLLGDDGTPGVRARNRPDVILLSAERVGPYVRALSAALSALAPGEDHVPLSAALDHLAALDPANGGQILHPAEVWHRTGMPAYTWLERARSEAEIALKTTGGPEPSEGELVRVHGLDAALATRMRDRRDLHRHLRTAELIPATRLIGAVRWFGRIDTTRSIPRMEATVGLAYDRMAPDGRWVRVRVEMVATGSVDGPMWVDRAGRLHLDERLRHLLTRHFADAPDALRLQLEEVTEARVTRISRSFIGPFWFPGVDLPDGLPPSLASGLLLHASTEVIDPSLRESRNLDPLEPDEALPGSWPMFRERRFAAAGQAGDAVRAWAEAIGVRPNVVAIGVGARPRRT